MRMMANAMLVAFTYLLLMDCVALAQGQQPDPRGLFDMRLGSPIIALESYTVRQDLKLTTEQDERLKGILEVLAEAEKKVGDGRNGDFASLTVEQKKARRAELRKKLAETNADAIALLTDEQKVRIRQIQIWIARGQALFTVDVREELKISDAQKESLLELFKAKKQKKLEIPMPADGTPDEKLRKMREQASVIDEEFDEQCLAVLTKEQRAKFVIMRGAKIEVDAAEMPFIFGRP